MKRKPKPKPWNEQLNDRLGALGLSSLWLLAESCASCSIEGNPQAEAAGRALDAYMKNWPMTEADGKALLSILVSLKELP